MLHKTYFKVTGNKSVITSQTKLLVLRVNCFLGKTYSYSNSQNQVFFWENTDKFYIPNQKGRMVSFLTGQRDNQKIISTNLNNA